MENRPRIFICYSHVDKARVDELEKQIAEAKIDYFRDTGFVDFGQNIMERVRSEISKSTHVLVYISAEIKPTDWVLCELGMAWGLERQLVGYPANPQVNVPEVMQPLRRINSEVDFTLFLAQLQQDDALKERMTVVEWEARDRLYYHSGKSIGYAGAIRLFGGGDEYITEDRLRVKYTHRNLGRSILTERSREFIKKKSAEARERNAMYFNGPNCRLIKWRATPHDGEGVAREQKILELELGPIGWYDYEGLNSAFRESLEGKSIVDWYNNFIGLQHLINGGDVYYSRLSNILDTATTLVTSDGYVGYQQRGGKVSAQPGKLTSAVAENINRYLDDCAVGSSQALHEAGTDEAELGKLDSKYKPRGVPHPFAAVRRGIAEEISGDLLQYLGRHSIKLIGISFDLQSLHPDLLFAVFVPLKKQDILEMWQANPGKDWPEGVPYFVPAEMTSNETERILEEKVNQSWVPGGKASLIATIRLVEAIRASRSWSFHDAFQFLVDAD